MAESIVGVDLSGPSNTDETVVVLFRSEGPALHYVRCGQGTDRAIRDLVSIAAETTRVSVGLDAPLSYQPGGGDRLRDKELRRLLVTAGLHPGSVMPPTMTRMGYLTLRGLAVARFLHIPNVNVVEVHPGGVFALRGAPIASVRSFRANLKCQLDLLHWLEEQGLQGILRPNPCTSHFVAACAAALGTHHWRRGQPAWLAAAELPFHPFDFAC
jgi:predicted nuclease with RNAse H fold